MPPRLFIVGATGYAGGDFIALLTALHPDLDFRAFVRNAEKARLLSETIPAVHCVVGSSHDNDLLATESEEADIVVQIADTDDEELSFTMLGGVSRNKSGVYIHISGAGNLLDLSTEPGVSHPRVYGDKSDAEEILNLPPDRPHAAIEQELIRRAASTNTKIVIVSFPMLYGEGRGIFAKHAGHFQLYVQGVLSHGKAFVVGAGANRISTSHVSDASAALVFVIEEVLKGRDSRIRWGNEGYYFVESSESSFKEIATDVAKVLHQKQLIKSTEIDCLDSESVSKIWSLGPLIWGLNARARAEKLYELGWVPSSYPRTESMGAVIDSVLTSIKLKAEIIIQLG
jgi:nucleoside-diphosphate-sugar epimerase